jgi:tetratricopeptide (TPR) repeat protein
MNVTAIKGTGNVVYDSTIEVIVTQVNLPHTSAEHLPEIWNVPPKNHNFVSRKGLLRGIENHLNKESTPVILTALDGLGGVGKTQLALEFVWQHHKGYNGVAWFNAESQERLTEDYIRLGLELNIIHQDDIDAIEKRALRVKSWLEVPKRAGWLLVYDNAPNYIAIGELIPKKGGKVLVTSRYAKGWPQGNIQVNVFTPDESRAYIEKTLCDKALDTKQVNQLAKTLGYLPLALAQACAYIKKNPVSIASYLELYETRKKKLLSDKTLADQTLPPDSNRATVYITWNITIEAIRKESILADWLLAICAYLNSNDIPNFLLNNYSESSQNNPNNEIFEAALGTLNSYSMLFINEQSSSASIHRLVQEVILLKAEAGERLKNIVALLELFQECFPYGGQTHEDYTKKRQLLPHLEAFLFNLDAWQKKATLELKTYIEENCLEKVLSFMNDGYNGLGNRQKAREMLERTLTIKEFRYGHDHPSTLTTRDNMAGVLSKQGKYEEALRAYQEVFDKRKDLLGPEHPDTLTTRHNMAVVLSKQGKYEEALQAYQEIFDIWKRELGPEHPSTLTTRDNMAEVLSKQGKYVEALQVYQQVFDKRKDLLGPEHPDTLTTRNNMAGVLSDQGKYDEALQAYQEVFDKRKDLLGPEHPDTLTTRHNMAGVLSKQGKYEEALQAYQEIFDIWKRELGPEHPSTLTTRDNMAGVLLKQGKYDEALQACQEVFDKRKDLLGPEHPDTLTTRHNMALVLSKQGKYEEALQAYQEIFDIWKRELGPEHPSALTTRDNMAEVLSKQGKYDEALQVYQQVFDKRKDLLGPEHPDTLTTRNNMAEVLLKQGKYDEALQACQEVFDIWKRELGPEHPDTLTTRNNMAVLLYYQGKYEEALQAYQEVFDKKKDLLGPEHPSTLTTQNNMAGVLSKQGKYDEALQAYKEVFDIWKRELGPEHPNTIITRNNIASTLVKQGKFEEAL